MMKKNILSFQKMKKEGEPITWITAYTYPIAKSAESAGVDMILVGDSGGMVELGYKSTNPVTMDEMIILSKAARKGAPNTFLVGDMPQGSYEISDEIAVENALRFIKESECDAVKLEGGERMVSRIRAITEAGILVVGHLGLTPQSSTSFGGYKVQCKTKKSFESTVKDAIAIENAGACMLLLEAIPEQPANQISMKIKIPSLGIGAGGKIDGQLIIMHDLLGFYLDFRPWFAKCYIPQVIEKYIKEIKEVDDIKKFGIDTKMDGLNNIVILAIKEYVDEVKTGKFPDENYSYQIQEGELDALKKSKFWS
jgi:3-methyl-2-oxobutanoate hydroxymethyltransferase